MASVDRRTRRLVQTFDRSAVRYERGRPGYPPEAIAFIGRTLGLGSGSTIVELGSGTGKFTRALRPLGAALVAVEPMEGMRKEFRRRVPDIPVLEGTAESIPLPDGFADAVVVAQAFHWFRPRPALREIARVLRPGGGLVLVWNTRDDRVRLSRRLSELVAHYGARRSYRDDPAWPRAFRGGRGRFRALRKRSFRHAEQSTPSAFLDRVLSVSLIAARPPAVRRRVVRAVGEMLASEPTTRGRSVVRLAYRTEVFYTRLRPPRRGR
jgi:SAM-dependent methyltransferase